MTPQRNRNARPALRQDAESLRAGVVIGRLPRRAASYLPRRATSSLIRFFHCPPRGFELRTQRTASSST